MKKLFVALAIIAVIVVGAWLLVRNRLRAAIEDRCAKTLNAECSVGGLSLRVGGASATDIHVSASSGALNGDVDAIEADFQWGALLLSRPQAVVVRVVHPQLREALPIGDVGVAMKNMGEGKRPDGTPSSLTLDQLTVSDGDLLAKMSLLADVHVQGISAQWAPKSPLRVKWTDASVSSLLGDQSTGACTIETPAGGHVADVDCPKVKTKIDLSRLHTLADVAKIFLKK